MVSVYFFLLGIWRSARSTPLCGFGVYFCLSLCPRAPPSLTLGAFFCPSCSKRALALARQKAMTNTKSLPDSNANNGAARRGAKQPGTGRSPQEAATRVGRAPTPTKRKRKIESQEKEKANRAIDIKVAQRQRKRPSPARSHNWSMAGGL
jgi:hypothetical protein